MPKRADRSAIPDIMAGGDARARVIDTIYRGTTITHLVEMETGSLQVGDAVEARSISKNDASP